MEKEENLGNALFEVKARGADEALAKLNEIVELMTKVRVLTYEVSKMAVSIDLLKASDLQESQDD